VRLLGNTPECSARRGINMRAITRRRLLLSSAALALLLSSKVLHAAFAIFQVNGASSQQQGLPIGGVGQSRGQMMAADGTMYVWNDSTGAWKGTTAAIPGAGAGSGYQWKAVLNASNAPSSWLQAPTPYLGWANATYEIACSPSNSNIIYMMYNAYAGSTFGVLLKSVDGGATWSLTNYPSNSNNGNSALSGLIAQTICIDPNNTNIVWASDGTQLRVTADGGSTWTSVNPAGSAATAYAMCYDIGAGTTGGSTNRLIVGIPGHGIYVTTTAYNGASASWSLISGSTTTPGKGKIGSDGTYYCSDTSSTSNLYSLARGGSSMATIFSAEAVFSFAVDPNNPARVFIGHDGGGYRMCSAAANTGNNPGWTGAPSSNSINTTDAPWFGFGYGSSANINQLGFDFDPWTTTSATTINLSSLSAGGSTGTIAVPAGIANITTGRQLRCTNTGTPGNYFIFTVTSYSGTSLQGTIISSAQGGYIGGPIGGSGSFSAWTISAERAYGCSGAQVYYDGFTTAAAVPDATCTFGLEASYIGDVKWPVGGNPVMTAQDRAIFQVPTNPWGSLVGVVNGYSPVAATVGGQCAYVDFSKADPTFWVCVSENGGVCFSTTSGKSGTFAAYTNQPLTNNAGPIACAVANVIVVADRTGGIYYTQNGATASATWTLMPSPAPTSGWYVGGNSIFQPNATLCADKTTVTAPYLFYALNADGHVYKFSVPASGSPTVTQGGTVGLLPPSFGGKMDSASGNAGHLFYSPGANDTTSTNYTQLFANHPAGGNTRLSFSSNGGASWTVLTTTQEVIPFGIGAAAPGSSYPTLYACGWCGGGSYGIYRCTNFNPSSLGSETWVQIGTYVSNFSLQMPIALGADPNQYGRFIIGTSGCGATIFEISGQANGWY